MQRFKFFYQVFLICMLCVSAHANITSKIIQNQSSLLREDEVPTGMLKQVSCVGEGPTAICVAVGYTYANNIVKPVLLQTLNSGKNWQNVNLDSFPLVEQLESVSCTGKESDALCVAVGERDQIDGFIIQSRNGGKNWEKVAIGNFPALYMRSVSCSGEKDKAMCVAWGIGDNEYVLFQTLDGGKVWQKRPIEVSDFGSHEAARSVSCSGDANQGLCVAASNEKIFQFTTEDNTWRYVPLVYQSPSSGLYLASSSCTGRGKNAVCAVSGYQRSDDPMLSARSVVYSTINGGETWQVPHFYEPSRGSVRLMFPPSIYCKGDATNLMCMMQPTYGGLYGLIGMIDSLSMKELQSGSFKKAKISFNLNVYLSGPSSCYNTSDSLVCVSVGGQNTNTANHYLPLIIQGHNNDYWAEQKIQGMDEGTLASVSCSQDGSICVAVGENHGMNLIKPVIIQSTDHGASWSLVVSSI